MGELSKGDLLFIGAVVVVFVFGVAVPAIRQHRDRQIFDAPTSSQRRARRPPD